MNGRIESALPRLRQHWLSCDDLLEMAAQLAAQLAEGEALELEHRGRTLLLIRPTTADLEAIRRGEQ